MKVTNSSTLTLTSSQLKNNVSYSPQDRHLSDRHHSNGDGRIDVSATEMQAAHGQGRDAEAKRQRNHLRGRWMVHIPSDCRTSGQEDEEEGRDEFHEGAGPEVEGL